jgi:hypothetical protein
MVFIGENMTNFREGVKFRYARRGVIQSFEFPKLHPARFLDPREVEKHFAPLLKSRPSPEQRWAQKSEATAFPGL